MSPSAPPPNAPVAMALDPPPTVASSDGGRTIVLTRVVVLLTILGGFLLRAHHLDYQSFWRDEMDAVTFASWDLSKLAHWYVSIGENGPLYFTLLHFWLPLSGRSDYAVRYSTLVVGVVSIPLLYVLGSKLFGRRAGAVAAVLLAGNPYHVWYSQETKMYAAVAMAGILSVLLLLTALRSERWWPWIAWLLLLGASFYLHIFMALLIVFEAGAVLIAWVAGVPGARRGGKLLLLLAIPYLPLAAWELPILLHGQPSSYQFFAPDAILSILLAKFSVGLQQPTALARVLFAFLFLAGLLLPTPGTVRGARALVFGWYVVPIALFFVVSLRVPLFLDRYLIIILPAYLLLLARGLRALAQRSLVVTSIAVAGLTLLSIPGTWSQPLVKMDFKRAVVYLDAHQGPGDTIAFIPSWERTYYNYYHPRPYHWLDLPWVDQTGLASAAVPAEQALERPHTGLWLVTVERQYGDRHQALQAWLDRHATLVSDKPLAHLDIRYYHGPVRRPLPVPARPTPP